MILEPLEYFDCKLYNAQLEVIKADHRSAKIQLKNDKVVKFPYGNIDEAIKKSIELLDRKDFENYNIIDLRIDGKIIVE